MKVDSDYNSKQKEFIPLLKGAEFEIRDINGKLITKLITDENGYAETILDYGKYKIVEVKPPAGYEGLDKDLLVEVDSSRNIIPIMVKNKKEEKPIIPIDPEEPEEPVERPGIPVYPPKENPTVPIVPIEPSYPEGTISWVEIEPSTKEPEKEINKP